MPRYEFVEGSSSKFWEIKLDGSSFETTYGRIGTDGQTSLKEYDSPDKAKKEYDKLVAEKVKKGYKLVSDGAAAPAAPAAPPPAPAKAEKAPAKKADAPSPAKKAAKPVFDDEGDDEGDEEEAPPKPAPKAAKAEKAAPPPAAAPASGAGPGERYFEFVEGSSSKFWKIKLDGSSFETSYGRIGTSGQISLKEYDSPDKAKKEYEKLVAEKVKKGYVEK
ncbi:MAG: WGR domain-containing protein [Polyangiaceae bacterium]